MANGKRSTSGRLQRRPRQRDPLPEPGAGSAAPRPTRKRVPGLRRATAEHAAPAAPGPCSSAGRTRNTRRRESVTSVLGRRREPPSWEGREPPQRPRPAQQQHPQSRLGRPDAAPDLSPATRKGFMRHQSESEVRASEGGTQHRPRREMPVTVGPHGQSQPNCFDRVKMGFMMGFAVGMAAGALFGTFSSLRIGMRGRELMGGIGKTMMQSGGTFGTFMAIGMGIRC